MSLTVKAGLAQSPGGAAGGDQFDAKAGQRLAQIDQAGLVGNAEQRSADRVLLRSFDVLTVQLPGHLRRRLRGKRLAEDAKTKAPDYIEKHLANPCCRDLHRSRPRISIVAVTSRRNGNALELRYGKLPPSIPAKRGPVRDRL